MLAVAVWAVAFLTLWTLFAPAPAIANTPARTLDHGPSDKPRIALTFDDNYQGEKSSATLRILKEYGVQATMFVIGHYTDNGPKLAAALAASGLEIGDHTRSHADCPTLSRTALRIEIGNGTETFRRMTGGSTVPLFRPPYGSTDDKTAEIAAEKGFSYVVLWDVDSEDWRGASADKIVHNVLSDAHNGAIVLMHMGAPHTYEALPAVIEGLRAKGFELVTLTTLLKGDRRFVDVDPATATGKAIFRLVDAGIVSGYNADYFCRVSPITRAQLAKVAVNAAGLHTAGVEHADRSTFSDVKSRHGSDGTVEAYPFDFVEEAAAAGLVTGGPDGQGGLRFDPGANVTRLQLAHIVARMARRLKGYSAAPPEAGAAFRDVPQADREDVGLAASLGLMTGYSSTHFSPWEPAERGHVAVVMSRFLDLPAAGGQPASPTKVTTTIPPGTALGSGAMLGVGARAR